MRGMGIQTLNPKPHTRPCSGLLDYFWGFVEDLVRVNGLKSPRPRVSGLQGLGFRAT